MRGAAAGSAAQSYATEDVRVVLARAPVASTPNLTLSSGAGVVFPDTGVSQAIPRLTASVVDVRVVEWVTNTHYGWVCSSVLTLEVGVCAQSSSAWAHAREASTSITSCHMYSFLHSLALRYWPWCLR
jgi:hypothetical protein